MNTLIITLLNENREIRSVVEFAETADAVKAHKTAIKTVEGLAGRRLTEQSSPRRWALLYHFGLWFRRNTVEIIIASLSIALLAFMLWGGAQAFRLTGRLFSELYEFAKTLSATHWAGIGIFVLGWRLISVFANYLDEIKDRKVKPSDKSSGKTSAKTIDIKPGE